MNNIIDFFKNFDFSSWASDIKIIFLVLAAFFVALGIFSMFKARALLRHGHKNYRGHGASPVAKHEPEPEQAPAVNSSSEWEQIKQRANSVREADWKLSIIEADKLVDDTLKQLGYAGETMGERLMLIAPDQLMSLQDLWDAHKLRNLLVHKMSYQVRHEQVLAAIDAFDRVLRELGAIT